MFYDGSYLVHYLNLNSKNFHDFIYLSNYLIYVLLQKVVVGSKNIELRLYSMQKVYFYLKK